MPSSELSELSKLRVCFLTNNLRQDNGAGVFSRRLIDGLKKELGIDPVIFTSEANPKLWRRIFEIRREIKKCDAVHALDGYPYAVIAYVASLCLGKKFIITAVGSGAVIHLYKPIYSWFLRRAYRAADKVVAVSNFTAREILEKVPNLAIEVINHGVDYRKFQIPNDKLQINSKFQTINSKERGEPTPPPPLPKGGGVGGGHASFDVNLLKPYILSVGSLRWRKGYHRSIEVFAKVAESFPNLKYIIVGKKYDEAYYNRLKSAVKNLKLEDRVLILDNVDDENDVIALYQNAELFCLMAQTAHRDLEGFGLVFLEAAAAGLPVIGTKGSGVEDAVLDGKNGFLADDPRNTDKFAEAIVHILQNSNVKIQMSNESRNFAKDSSWEKRIAEYVSMYKNLNKPKIVYVTNTRLPTEKAHGLATVKITEAFADLGYVVEMVIPRRRQGEGGRKRDTTPLSGDEVFRYYGVKPNFKIKKLSTLDFFPLRNLVPKWGEKPIFWIQLFSFSLTATLYSVLKYRHTFKNTIFFSHDHVPLWFLSWCGAKIFYDIHHFPDHNIFYERVLRKSFGLAIQTRWKAGELKERFGVDPAKVVYWPNGTDVEKFAPSSDGAHDRMIGRNIAREKLNLPQDKKIIVYTGQLFDWKGIDTFIKTAADLKNIDFYVVGGSKEEILNLKSKILNLSNIHFIGQRPHQEIPLWLLAADVLVLPNTGKQKVSLYYTSPMKMFEYMASGTPIVASAIPSILEILNVSNAILAEADNPHSFADKITYALANYQMAERLGLQAQKDVQKYTWHERARRISARFA